MEPNNKMKNGRRNAGFFLVGAGLLLFAYKMGAPIPEWVLSWQFGLFAFGFLIALKDGFRHPGGGILMLVGGLSLADRLIPTLNLHTFILPLIIIIVGLAFIFRPKGKNNPGSKWRENEERNSNAALSFGEEKKTDDFDFVDSTSIFGGVKKVILSKNFKGGDITCFMGGSEFNMSQADIKGTAELDVTQIFGGTKIIVPANWDIKTDVVNVFGSIEDKRPVIANAVNSDKVLIIRGTSVFGGIEITSY